MEFQNYRGYHFYPQGNNRQTIFYSRKNYIFFLDKMRTHLLPCCKILAYCLMPNHFHWLIFVEKNKPLRPADSSPVGKLLIKNIATLLSSYTQAINKLHDRSGS